MKLSLWPAAGVTAAAPVPLPAFGVGVLLFALLIAAAAPVAAFAPPARFEEAKVLARNAVYHDRNEVGTFYCGCRWTWRGRSGGVIDHASCGYRVRANAERAARMEWEHVVPASNFGQSRPCWKAGGRERCQKTDAEFARMEADLHNLTPAVGEVNEDRGNFRFAELGAPDRRVAKESYGRCAIRIDAASRSVEPPDAVKGQVARIYLYMHDRYRLSMSAQQQKLMLAWHQQYPPTDWERERDRRIAAVMGHGNPFVGGVRTAPAAQPAAPAAGVRGNRSSGVYHLASGCPGYERIAPRNLVEFASEQAARDAGFRKAGNCR